MATKAEEAEAPEISGEEIIEDELGAEETKDEAGEVGLKAAEVGAGTEEDSKAGEAEIEDEEWSGNERTGAKIRIRNQSLDLSLRI